MYGTTLDGERVVVHTTAEWAEIEAEMARLRQVEMLAEVARGLLASPSGAGSHGGLVRP